MISIVIPARNAAATLGEQLEALAKQAGDFDCEVIVADNGSSDGTRGVAERYRGRFSKLVVIDASRVRGPGAARNAGVAVARGEMIAFCDADDVVGDGWLNAISQALEKHPLVGGPLITHVLNEPWLIRTRPWLAHLEKGLAPNGFLPWAATANLGVRRELHARIGGFDEALRAQEDQDYCWRASMAGAPIVFEPTAMVHYRLRSRMWDIYQQAKGYAQDYPALFRKYRPHGLRSAPVGFGAVVRLWGFPGLLLRDLPKALKSREATALWALRVGLRVGSLKGTLRYRFPLQL